MLPQGAPRFPSIFLSQQENYSGFSPIPQIQPSLERKTKPNSGLPADLRYASRISAKAGIIGTESRLARVFGRLTTDLHIERLILNSVPV
jgi:hypothetical protein